MTSIIFDWSRRIEACLVCKEILADYDAMTVGSVKKHDVQGQVKRLKKKKIQITAAGPEK